MAATMFSDVLIIGAGASGLTAAHDLLDIRDSGLSVTILEARPRLGGRVHKLEDFAGNGVSIDVGGEWLATDPSFLTDISGLDSSQLQVEWLPWYPTEYQYNEKDGTWDDPLARDPTLKKWSNGTWFDFFDTYIATPSVRDNIVHDCSATTVDHTNTLAPVVVTCQDGRSFQANHAIVTVPIPILQQDITFTPPLPDKQQQAIDQQEMLPGLKVVMKFQSKFYKDVFMLEEWDYGAESGRYFYNPFLNQPHDAVEPKNVLIAELLGDFAASYIDMTDEQILQEMIQDMDRAYNNAGLASSNLLDWRVFNWNKQPYTRGVYSNGAGFKDIDILEEPINEQGTVLLAGEAIPPKGTWYGYVHGAAYSGRRAADLVAAAAAANAGNNAGDTFPEVAIQQPPPPDIAVEDIVPEQVQPDALTLSPGNSNTAGFASDVVASKPSLLSLANRTPELSSLRRLLMSSGVGATLDSGGPYTIFAPANGALPSGIELLMLQGSTLLQTFLLDHVVFGEYSSSDLVSGMTLETVGGGTITVEIEQDGAGTEVTTAGSLSSPIASRANRTPPFVVSSDYVAKVTYANMEISNGMVHLCNQALVKVPTF